jgi:hypothetical protein
VLKWLWQLQVAGDDYEHAATLAIRAAARYPGTNGVPAWRKIRGQLPGQRGDIAALVVGGCLRLSAGNGGHVGTYSTGLELNPDLRFVASRHMDAEPGRRARPDDERWRQHATRSLLPPGRERGGGVACVDAECRQDGDEGGPRHEAVSALPVPELGRNT